MSSVKWQKRPSASPLRSRATLPLKGASSAVAFDRCDVQTGSTTRLQLLQRSLEEHLMSDVKSSAPLSLVAAHRDATILPRTTRELAMLVERQTQQVDALLRALAVERELNEARRNPPVQTPPGSTEHVQATPPPPTARKRVLEALATANGGLPGKLTTVQVQQLLGLTKSEVWHAYAGRASKSEQNLVNSGDVVVLKGRNGGPDVLVHRDAIVVA